MNFSPNTLLVASLCGYSVAAVAGLLFMRRERLAAAISFGVAALSASSSLLAGLLFLAGAPSGGDGPLELLPPFLPYLKFTVRLDALGAFFLLIVSLLGLAVSIYSLGYVRGYFGRRNVGVLGAFYNALLLATTLLFAADNIWVFLIAWELTALTAFCLVVFEHEKPETRQAGVLFFIMSHIDAGFPALSGIGRFQFQQPAQHRCGHVPRPEERRFCSFPDRFWHQIRHHPPPHLAAGGPSGRAQQRLRADVRRAHQIGRLWSGACLL
jgi:hydrogenase-4 component B